MLIRKGNTYGIAKGEVIAKQTIQSRATMPIKTQLLLFANRSRATTSVAYAKYSIIQEKSKALHKPIKNIIIRKNKAKNAKS